jgi:glucan phosphoethanolaminetransferase (alkaline phosphatase superfamily)
MHTKYKNQLSVALYFIAWLAPAIALLVIDLDRVAFEKLMLTMLLVGIWHLAFKNFLHGVYFSLFVFLLLPFDLFFLSIYKEAPTTAALLSVGNTNWEETVGFMHGRVVLLIAIGAAVILVWLFAARAGQQGCGAKWRCFNPVTRYPSRIFIAVLVTLWGVFTFAPTFVEPSVVESAAANTNFSKLDQRLASAIVKLKGIFPVGRFVSMGEYYREEATLRYAEQLRHKMHLNAKQVNAPGQRQIYVLVLGETARGDHSSLNGYERETAPLLAKQNNLVPIHNIVTPWNVTRLSVPTILSGQQSYKNGNQLKTVISAFREAGFKTYWLSSQQITGSIITFAQEADEKLFLSISAQVMERYPNYDGSLLLPLRKLINRNEPRQFFVIHLLGSHEPYQRRYPKEFDLFQPSLMSKPGLSYHDVKNKTEVINTYDNTMRYTDYVLSNIIETVEQANGVSALLYSSDHGETLFDGSCELMGHGGSARHDYIVNAFSWMSNEHKKYWPEKYRLMKERSNAPITTEFIFDTMLGLANIGADKASPTHNMAGADFQPQERWVNTQQLLNWDSAHTEGPCKLIVSSLQK